MANEDLLARVRRVFPGAWISEDYVNGVFDSITLQFTEYETITFDKLAELSEALETKDINITMEDGTDWGGQTGKESDKVLVVVRGWKS